MFVCLNYKQGQISCLTYFVKLFLSFFYVKGPPEDEEAGSELSVTQLKELRQKQLEEQEELKRKLKESKMETHEEPKEQRGISWGMSKSEKKLCLFDHRR